MKKIISSILVFTLISVPTSGAFATQSTEGQPEVISFNFNDKVENAKEILHTAEGECFTSVCDEIFDKSNDFKEKVSFNYYDLLEKFVSCYKSKFSKEDFEKNVMAYFNKTIEGKKQGYQGYIDYCVDYYVNQTKKAFSSGLNKILYILPNIININYEKDSDINK